VHGGLRLSQALPEVIGKYRIERFIESGGMGDVYLARDPALDRPVAIKFLREGFDNEEMRERFEREARAAGRISHPNIVTIYEFGECDRRPFIAMEFVRGEPLSKRIRRHESMPTVRKLELMEGLCAGLAHAHKAGIVHRDIKPANLMVDTDAPLKILDFGIVRMAGSGLTSHGVLVGTVNYMSPEQISGLGTIDHRSDVFAVGAVMHEIFTYQRAFPGEMTDVLYKIVHVKAESAGALMPGLDPAIVRAIDLCLDKSPDRRYQDLSLLRRDLARIRHRLELEDPETHGHSIGHSAAVARGPQKSGQRSGQKTTPIVPPPVPVRDQVAARQQEAARLAKARAEEAEKARVAREQADKAMQEEARRAREEAQRAEAEQAARVAAERKAEAQRQQEAEQARLDAERRAREAVEPQLASARELFAREDFTAASRIVQGVLQQIPTHPGARALELEIVRGVELRAKATHAVEQARQAFETRPVDALDALRRFTPPHALVTRALAELGARQEATERARREQARRERTQAMIAQARALAGQRPVQIGAAALVALVAIVAAWGAMGSDQPDPVVPATPRREATPPSGQAERREPARPEGGSDRSVDRPADGATHEPTKDEGNARIDDAPPPTAPIGAQAIAKAEIEAWIADYGAAFRALDERRAKAMNPRAPLSRSEMRSADATFSNVSIETAPDGRNGWLRGTVKYTYTWRRAGQPPETEQTVAWPMRKSGRGWVVY
jgi:serine/threonine protein kinase